eukprot:3723158-Prymnesium_polylepis.1
MMLRTGTPYTLGLHSKSQLGTRSCRKNRSTKPVPAEPFRGGLTNIGSLPAPQQSHFETPERISRRNPDVPQARVAHQVSFLRTR